MIECWGRRFSDFLCPPPLVGEMRRGSSPLYFPVIDQPSALTSQRTDGVLQVGFECCFVQKSITRDEEYSAKNRVFNAQIAQKLVFEASPKSRCLSRKSPVKKSSTKALTIGYLHWQTGNWTGWHTRTHRLARYSQACKATTHHRYVP